MNANDVFCIVVAFNPSEKLFLQAIKSINTNTPNIIIVNNGENFNTLDVDIFEHITIIDCKKNQGISCAQNLGIRAAIENGARYIWLSDQDTVYPENFLEKMLVAIDICQAQGTRLGALAPSYFDTHKGTVQALVRHAPFTQKFPCKPGLHHVSHAIASGTLIPTSALRDVGLMQENLFIDWVDLEWCWRAKNRHGYDTICTGDVVIEHTMGDGSVQFRGKKVSIRSPLRHYYMVRNAVHIALHSRSATVPIRFEIFAKSLAWTLVFPLIAPTQKRQHLRATLAGLWDGLRNRMGEKVLD